MYVRLQSRWSAKADALTVAGLSDRGRATGLATGATVSDISVIPVASRQDSSRPVSAAIANLGQPGRG
ncbi:hypothetical protein CT676_24530 [Bradyrhizobium sp. MOS001]|nr:hypothetical protein CT676_24530 [Bradyrhizobium sp. MOS001]